MGRGAGLHGRAGEVFGAVVFPEMLAKFNGVGESMRLEAASLVFGARKGFGLGKMPELLMIGLQVYNEVARASERSAAQEAPEGFLYTGCIFLVYICAPFAQIPQLL